MFAILGAAGKVGYSTALALREAGVPVRAILRDPAKADRLRAIGCEVAVADLQDPAALGRAIADAQAVQLICPTTLQALDAVGDMRRSIDSMARALEQARPGLVLAISDYGAHVTEDIGMPSVFHGFEQRLRQLPMPKVFLRSAEHMEGWRGLIPVAAASGVLPSFHQQLDKPFPTVSAQDVGRMAAELLQHPGVAAGEHIVHAEGPRRYAATDVAETLGQLLGRTVSAQAVPRALWMEKLGRIVSESTARLLVGIYDAHDRGGLIDVEPGRGAVRYGTTGLLEALRPLVPQR
ncbi:NAD(P)H-binding protein [Acidovorax sp. LjRoot66]|uniref:NmrA family NAD(P)-binding protein n=1 Tax=Acidovorax sp. LjRoot66 TaxID=3342334 RepID=UPI003ECC4B9C